MTPFRVQVTRIESYTVKVEAPSYDEARRTALARVKHGYVESESEDFETEVVKL